MPHPVTEQRLAQQRKVHAPISALMDAVAPLTREALVQKLADTLNAERSVFATSEGAITDERKVPDAPIQLRALNMALMLRNEYPARQVDASLTLRMEQLPDLSHLPARELARLAGMDDDEVVEAEVLVIEPPVEAPTLPPKRKRAR